MFTGIVEEVGTVRELADLGDSARLTVEAPGVSAGASTGDSVAVEGCCLTVSTLGPGSFGVDVMRSSLDRTALGSLEPGARVNLERAATPATALGGHLVQGHVDGTARVLARTPSEHWDVVEVSLPRPLARYLVPQGSVTVSGVSLTVVEVSAEPTTDAGWFSVSLVPETLARTTLGVVGAGDTVNLEVDVIAKYVERLLDARGRGQVRQ